METILCKVCGGYGETFGAQSAEYPSSSGDLNICSRCGGKGQLPCDENGNEIPKRFIKPRVSWDQFWESEPVKKLLRQIERQFGGARHENKVRKSQR